MPSPKVKCQCILLYFGVHREFATNNTNHIQQKTFVNDLDKDFQKEIYKGKVQHTCVLAY